DATPTRRVPVPRPWGRTEVGWALAAPSETLMVSVHRPGSGATAARLAHSERSGATLRRVRVSAATCGDDSDAVMEDAAAGAPAASRTSIVMAWGPRRVGLMCTLTWSGPS